MDIVDRLVAYKNYTGLSNSQFADKAGIPRPTLSQFLNGRNKRLSDDLTSKLHQAYPDLNVMWLLFGEGDMVSDANIEFSEGKTDPFAHIEVDQVADFEDPAPYGSIFHSVTNSDQSTQPQHSPASESNIPHSFAGIPAQPLSEAPASVHHTATDSPKKIKSIMVFYSDNSYEIFTPGASSDN